jgi:ankyrin repeat protein
MDFYDKYIKYKNKYIALKNQNGGALLKCDDVLFLTNNYGTCWNASIQMIFLFGDITSCEVQKNIIKEPDIIINDILKNNDLSNCLPFDFFENDDYNTNRLKPDVYDKILNLLLEYKKRFDIKKCDYIENKKSTPSPYNTIIRRQRSKNCEISFTEIFFNLTNKSSKKVNIGGNDIDLFLLILIIGLFLCKQKIEYTTYLLYDDNYIDYDNVLNSHYKQGKIDIEMAKNSIGIIVALTEHTTCFYKCNNIYKYYDSSNSISISNFNWIIFFEKINELIEKKVDFYLYQKKLNIVDDDIVDDDIVDDDIVDDDIVDDDIVDDDILYDNIIDTNKLLFNQYNKIFIISKSEDKLYYLNDNNIEFFSLIKTIEIIKKLNKDDYNYFKFDYFKFINYSTEHNLQYKNSYLSMYLDYYIVNKEIDIDELIPLFTEQVINNKINVKGDNLLILAIEDNKVDISIKILSKITKIDIDVIDENGNTPLILSIICNKDNEDNKSVLSTEILKKTCNVDIVNNDGYTALSLAIENKQYILAEKILEKTRNVETIDSDGNTPLSLAIENGQYELAIKILDKLSKK